MSLYQLRAQRFGVRWSGAGSILAARQWGNSGQPNHLNRKVGDRPETRRSASGHGPAFLSAPPRVRCGGKGSFDDLVGAGEDQGRDRQAGRRRTKVNDLASPADAEPATAFH